MREGNDWGRCRATLEIALRPFELLVAEIAEAAGLQVDTLTRPITSSERKHLGSDHEAECLRSLEVDDQFELGRLFDP
jgi:hypothetical protein